MILKKKTDKLILVKMKNFCPVKYIVFSQPQTGRKYFQITYLSKDFYVEYIKSSNSEKKFSHLKNGQIFD